MIDLKKPLEGVPGLLLMAALVLFGVTIGVTVALALSWVEMKDSIANFLGGVVGAGLGAALAVMGAVYVNRKRALDQEAAAAREALHYLEKIRLALFDLRPSASTDENGLKAFAGEVQALLSRLETFPSFHQISASKAHNIDAALRTIAVHLRALIESTTTNLAWYKRFSAPTLAQCEKTLAEVIDSVRPSGR